MTEQEQLYILNLIEEQLNKEYKEIQLKRTELEIQNNERILCNNILDKKYLYEDSTSTQIQNILQYKNVEGCDKIDEQKAKLEHELYELTKFKIPSINNLKKSIVETFKVLKGFENNEQTEDNSIKD
jgi:hypothetical protein